MAAARGLGCAVRAGIVDQENVDSLTTDLLQQRTNRTIDNVSFISGRNDYGDLDRIYVHICRRSGRIDAPKASPREHEIGPD